MLEGVNEADEYNLLALTIWRNASEQIKDSKTDKYTNPNGMFIFQVDAVKAFLKNENEKKFLRKIKRKLKN